MFLHPHATAWGAALRAQNADLVVRCDACGLAALTTCEAGPHDERLLWPRVPCVFDGACFGRMRREWLN